MIFWLLTGALFIFLEAMAMPGVGFLFAGLAALTVGGLLQFGVVDGSQYLLQAAIFLGTSFVWAAILWVPLQKFLKKQKNENFSNIVGDVATIYNSPLVKGKVGEVKWSGTIMQAVLSGSANVDKLDEGVLVKIIAVQGNILEVVSK